MNRHDDHDPRSSAEPAGPSSFDPPLPQERDRTTQCARASSARIDRRRFLQALGLGGAALAGASVLGRTGLAAAQLTGAAPRRVLFWITPHGTVWNAWNMALPGLAPSSTSSAPLAGATFSRILAPLAPHAAKLSIVEGLARTAAIEYERAHDDDGGAYDLNRHHFGSAHLMTCAEPRQRPGTTCIGGAVSIDQVIGRASAAPGRWASRVYGSIHGSPYSFVAPGEESARVETARRAFDDVVGAHTPAEPSGSETRASRIRRARGSVLDFASGEYARIAARLGREDREKLERHAQLIRDLEASFEVPTAPPVAACVPSWSELGHEMDQFARVSALALACDRTRVVTYVTPDLAPGEIGLPVSTDIHQDYAHTSIRGSSSAFSDEGERGMIEYNLFYARRFAYLLEQLDAIPEGSGSVLDNTAVVWMSELGTGAHDLHDLPIVIAGACGGTLRAGQYVRYAREHTIGAGWGFETRVGPSQNQLYVTLMRAMGMAEDEFGVASVTKSDGSALSLRGPLAELMR